MTLPPDWLWALAQGDAAQRIPPLAIHQQTFPRGHADRPVKSAAIIRSRPFTVDFERYVDGEDGRAIVDHALSMIRTDPSMRLEFEIAWAIVHGQHDDPETLRAIMGSPNGFDAAVARGLRLLREMTERYVRTYVARTDERRRTAGEAQEARQADRNEIDTKSGRRRVRV